MSWWEDAGPAALDTLALMLTQKNAVHVVLVTLRASLIDPAQALSHQRMFASYVLVLDRRTEGHSEPEP